MIKRNLTSIIFAASILTTNFALAEEECTLETLTNISNKEHIVLNDKEMLEIRASPSGYIDITKLKKSKDINPSNYKTIMTNDGKVRIVYTQDKPENKLDYK